MSARRRTSLLAWLGLLAFSLNLAWELAQAPLYTGGSMDGKHFALCLVAALGDALFALILYALLALVHRDPCWVLRRGPADAVVVLGTGIAFAWVAESLAGALGWWAYGPGMPLVLGVGLLPLVQLAVLSLLTFELVGVRARHGG
ncbi:hypothetical protein DAETH_47060 (plasmid) [Deinococcus aetherius]|uniref:PreQ0 transporter n=1 Tax=Deinococcus aetherius TaxID=200252 RepID=A0ABN6RSD6_9DEIO|nr:hypothetical protein [Deinococcus aetherius]BDP44737.1 hypothetical protein DAETH_47060 [Deinococcus aetherius]